MLERLERDNLFVVALDHERRWFRYHHLFREMLQAELERREPELVATLNGRAAAWCEASGQPEDAIEYAAAAGDLDELASLVTASAFPFFRAGRATTVERWLAMFDDEELLQRYPAIAVFGVWVHALRGRPDEAERWALAAENPRYDGLMPDGSPVDAWVATVRALLCRNGVERMRRDADARRQLTDGHQPVAARQPSSCRASRPDSRESGMATAPSWSSGRLRTRPPPAARSGRESSPAPSWRSWRSSAATLDDAEAELALARDFVDDATSSEYVVTAILHAATARVEVGRGQGARARNTLATAQRARPQLTHVLSWFAVQTRLELAKAYLSVADVRGATTLCREAEDVLRRRPALGTLVDEAREVRARLSTVADESSGWASTLTAAELRLLPLLTTHLSFREIAERLFVSRNTVKTQAISVYRKLDATSRSEAIDRAIELGLVDAPPASRATDFIRSG